MKSVTVEGVGSVQFPDDATEQEIQETLNRDYPKPPPQTSAVGALLRQGAQGVLPAIGAGVGGKIGAAALSETGPVGSLIGAGVGAVAGGMGTGYLQERLVHDYLPGLEELNVADIQQHPVASAAGRLASMAVPFEFAPGASIAGIRALGPIFRGTSTAAERGAATSTAVQLGAQLGITGAQTALQGRLPTPGEAAESAAAALLFGRGRGPLAIHPSTKGVTDAIPKRGPAQIPLEVPPGDRGEVGAQVPQQEEIAIPQTGPPKVPPKKRIVTNAEGKFLVTDGQQALTRPYDTREEAGSALEELITADLEERKPRVKRPKTATIKTKTGVTTFESSKPLPEEITKAERDYQAHERAAIDAAKDAGIPDATLVDVNPEDPNVPFNIKSGDGIAWVDPKDGIMRVNQKGLREWIDRMRARGLPEETIRQVVGESMATEEFIHTKTDPRDAQSYWNNLTALEKYTVERGYTGERGGQQRYGLTDAQMGSEAIRRMVQRLHDITPAEVAEFAGREHWTQKALNMLEDIIFKLRKALGTSASKLQQGYLDRVLDNIEHAKKVVQPDLTEVPLMLRRRGGEDTDWTRKVHPFDLDYSDLNTVKNYAEAMHRNYKDTEFPPYVVIKHANQPNYNITFKDRTDLYRPDEVVYETTGEPGVSFMLRRKSGADRDRERIAALRAAAKPPAPREGPLVNVPRETLVARREELRANKDFGPEFNAITDELVARQTERTGTPAAATEVRGKPTTDLTTGRLIEGVTGRGVVGQEPEARVTAAEAGAGVPEDVVGTAYKPITAGDVEAIATSHFSTDKAPDFDTFVEQVQKLYGPLVKAGQLIDHWQKAVWDNLMGASGARLKSWARELNLESRIVGTMRIKGSPSAAERFSGREIPDATSPRVYTGQLEFGGLVEEGVSKRAQKVAAEQAEAGQRFRNRVISSIAQKLIGQATETRFSKPLIRTELTTDDLMWWAASPGRVWRDVAEHEASNPDVLGRIITEDAMVSGKKKSVTKRVVALLDRNTGQVHMVSAYLDGRRGPVITDPARPSKFAPADIELSKRIGRFRAIYTALVEPVEGFHQRFRDIAEFNEKIGKEANETARRETARTPLYRQAAGLDERERVALGSVRITDAEAGGVYDKLTAMFPKMESPQAVRDHISSLALMAESGQPDWGAASAYEKIYRSILRKNPHLTTDEGLTKLYEEVYNQAQRAIEDKTGREGFIAQILQGHQRPDTEPIQPGGQIQVPGAPIQARGVERELTMREPPPRMPPSRTPLPRTPSEVAAGEVERLTPEQQRYVEARAAEKVYPPEKLGERPLTTYRPTEAGASYLSIPTTESSVAGRKFRPPESRGAFAGPPRKMPGVEEHIPLMLARGKDAATRAKETVQDELTKLHTKVDVHWNRRDIIKAIPVLTESASNTDATYSAAVKWGLVYESSHELPKSVLEGRLPVGLTKAYREASAKALRLRGAARAMIATGWTNEKGVWLTNMHALDEQWEDAKGRPHMGMDGYVQMAMDRAERMLQSKKWNDRRVGRAWMRGAQRLKDEVQAARELWAKDVDPKTGKSKLRQYVDKLRQELEDEIKYENDNGGKVTHRESYLPSPFEREWFDDAGVWMRGVPAAGRNFRMAKKFNNVYHAIANGPYIPMSYDTAEIAQSRIFLGRSQVSKRLIKRQLAQIKDPATKQPIAHEAIPIFGEDQVTDPGTGEQVTIKTVKGFSEGSKDRVLVRIGEGGTPMSVLSGYERVIRDVFSTSAVPNFTIYDVPMGAAALQTNIMMKHGVILAWDFFHPGRLFQYAAAIGGKNWKTFNMGYNGGWAAINFRPEDIPGAVRKGLVTQNAADWALGVNKVRLGNKVIEVTNHEILHKFIEEHGLNAAKITDAIYKDAIRSIPLVGESWHKIISPINRWVFDRMTPGLIAESAVRNFVRINRQNPNIDANKLMRDIARDVNLYYGNMGKQGIFRNATLRDLASLTFLAPLWQEGIIGKEAVTYARLLGGAAKGVASLAGKELGYRKGLPTMGAAGRGVLRGLLAYMIGTQVINLITRGHLTFDNEEKEHKFDAFIPLGEQGIWLSPASVFAEVLHDLVRLGSTKKKVYDVIAQMGENRLGPLGRFEQILRTGTTPTGARPTTTLGVVGAAFAPFATLPISAGKPIQMLAHAVVPSLVPPNRPGEVPRQILSTFAGMKTEVGRTNEQRMRAMADDFLRKEGLRATPYEMVQTDEPSYTKLRGAIRNDDEHGAARILDELRKTRSDQQIIHAMKLWSRHPFTGSKEHEKLFLASLSDTDMEAYYQAMMEKQDQLVKFEDFFLRNSR